MNLLKDKWIPVRPNKLISVSEITNPKIIDLDFPRPDFNASIKNLLIGVLQTAMAPKTEDEWAEYMKKRLSAQTLKEALQPFEKYFSLDEPINGIRFMQDYSMPEDCSTWPIQSLFIDGPKAKTIKDKKDFFKKDGAIQGICPSCAAALLYTMNTMAWTGGKGYYTSIRSGNTSILSMIAEGQDLWETLWLNVLPKKEMNKFGTPKELLFPWTKPYRAVASPENSDPCHLYWEMPWRSRLVFEQGKTHCDCCGQETDSVVIQGRVKNPGTKYTEDWKHPLCPYGQKEEGDPYLTSDYSMRYPTIGSILSEAETKAPYPVKARQYKSILVYGPSMEGAKFLSWMERRIPSISIDKKTFNSMMDIQKDMAKMVYSAINRCWFSEAPAFTSANMDERLNLFFYTVVTKPDVLQLWFDRVQKEALDLYDSEISQSTKPGLARYLRKEIVEKMSALAEKKGLVFTPPVLKYTYFKKGPTEEQFQVSREFCSSLMKWYVNFQYNKGLKADLARVDSLEDVGSDLWERFMDCHDDSVLAMEDLMDKVSVAAVVLCNLKSSGPITLNEFCLDKPHLESKLQSIKSITEDWDTLRDVVRDTNNLDVINLFQSIINWA